MLVSKSYSLLSVAIFVSETYFPLKNPTMTALQKFFSPWKTDVATTDALITIPMAINIYGHYRF